MDPREAHGGVSRGRDGLAAQSRLPRDADERDGEFDDDGENFKRGLRPQRHHRLRGDSRAVRRRRHRDERDERAGDQNGGVRVRAVKNVRIFGVVHVRSRVIRRRREERGQPRVRRREKPDGGDDGDSHHARGLARARGAVDGAREFSRAESRARPRFHPVVLVFVVGETSNRGGALEVRLQRVRHVRVRALEPHVTRNAHPNARVSLRATRRDGRLRLGETRRVASLAFGDDDAAGFHGVRRRPRRVPRATRRRPERRRRPGTEHRHQTERGEHREGEVRLFAVRVGAHEKRRCEKVDEPFRFGGGVARERRRTRAEKKSRQRGEFRDEVRAKEDTLPPPGDVEQPRPRRHDANARAEVREARISRRRVHRRAENIDDERRRRRRALRGRRANDVERHRATLAIVQRWSRWRGGGGVGGVGGVGGIRASWLCASWPRGASFLLVAASASSERLRRLRRGVDGIDASERDGEGGRSSLRARRRRLASLARLPLAHARSVDDGRRDHHRAFLGGSSRRQRRRGVRRHLSMMRPPKRR